MTHELDLSSAVGKINRAHQHLIDLSQAIRRFVDADFCKVENKTYRRVLEWRQYPRSVVEELGFDKKVRFREVDSHTLEARVPVRYDSITIELSHYLRPTKVRCGGWSDAV